VSLAKQEIEALNAKYASTLAARRAAVFPAPPPAPINPGEHIWMGYERKRGKLAALNAFLRHGNAQADFAFGLAIPQS